MSDEDHDLKLASAIYNHVSLVDEYVGKLKGLLEDAPDDLAAFPFPPELVLALQKLLEMDKYIMTKLYEENQILHDGITKYVEKLNRRS